MANQALALYGDLLGFTSITIVPAGNPPHRQEEVGLLPAKQRFKLVNEAIYACSDLRVSPVELQMANEGLITYTHTVLGRLGAFAPNRRCIMLMGQDSFETLPSWYLGEALLKSCAFIVYERPDVGAASGKFQSLINDPNVEYHPLRIPPVGVSATYIRTLCHMLKDEPVGVLRKRLIGLMPEKALSYFLNNGLYTVWQ